jgi:REP element-mobilizing transposase RayT
MPGTTSAEYATLRSRSPRQRTSSNASAAVQLEMGFSPGRGGRRVGAGRPPRSGRRQVPHRSRPLHRAAHPVHVTLRTVSRSLRTQFVFPTVRNAIAAANRAKPGRFRVVHFSIQGNHLHLIVEASDHSGLIEGMRGLGIRIARRVNQLVNRRGRFFADRWHGRALEGPRAVRHALVYVLANFRKHECDRGAVFDIYSSAPYFSDFIEFPNGAPFHTEPRIAHALSPPTEPVVFPATTWLLSFGWKRHGKISVWERPAR